MKTGDLCNNADGNLEARLEIFGPVELVIDLSESGKEAHDISRASRAFGLAESSQESDGFHSALG